MIHNRSMGEAPFSLARFPDMKITFDFNEEQLENLEDILLEAKHNLPDDEEEFQEAHEDSPVGTCLLYTSPSPRDVEESRMPSSA